MNNFNDYQDFCKTTAKYPENMKLLYPLLGINGEVGEVCEKIKKHYRDGKPLDKDDLTKEIGDVCWYISAICSDLDISLQDVIETNVAKLTSRKKRGVINGDGDNR